MIPAQRGPVLPDLTDTLTRLSRLIITLTLISLPLVAITQTLVTISATLKHLLHNSRCQNAFNPLTNHQPAYLSYNETLSNLPHK